MNDNSSRPHQPVVNLDDRIARLASRHAWFSQHIDRLWPDLDFRLLARVLSVHALGAVRLGRLLRDRRALAIAGPSPVRVDSVIADLDDKLDRLSRYIDTHWPDPGSEQWGRLVTVYSQNVVRLSRLMHDRRALRDGPLDGLERAIDAALDHPGEEWGVDL